MPDQEPTLPDAEAWELLQQIFDEALGVPEAEREDFLQARCAGNEKLKNEIESLLASFKDGERALASSEFSIGQIAAEPTDLPSDHFPGYHLLSELSRGGQGVVYHATQLSTKREVALKVLLEGVLCGDQTRRRFEREVELVSTLKHPGIVPIHDSGLARGQYFYAMQFIRGIHPDEYVRVHDLDTRRKLELFSQICDAVDHAHGRGIVHRDLKPSNILVDEVGAPHVLDFGLAKLREPGLTEPERLSITGQVMGTLSYMSPEQAVGQSGEIDARSDVYSLGVLLYELLTGALPYQLSGSLAENLLSIRHTDPDFSRLKQSRINHEITTVLLKALSKEKERRYSNAGELRDDIKRFLQGAPIEAKRDSKLYVLQKTVRRHVIKTSIAVALIVGMVLGIIAIEWPQSERPTAEPLAALAPGELYSELDLEGQLITLEDMLRRGDRWDRLLEEIAMRFGHLSIEQFTPELNEQAQADLARMIALERFFQAQPHAQALQAALDDEIQSNAESSPPTSGQVNDLVIDFLKAAMAAQNTSPIASP